MSHFSDKVIEIVSSIPQGKVLSYGQVALYAGLPRMAREVGYVLRNTDGRVALPWWRVINKDGKITIKGAKYANAELQKKLLESEGVTVSDDFIVSMPEYRFIASEKQLMTFQLSNEYIKRVLDKYTP